MANRVSELRQEVSRDMWLAASAANQLAMLTPLYRIETELLEALASVCLRELYKRGATQNGYDQVRRQ